MVDHNLYFDEVRVRLVKFFYVYQGGRLSIGQTMSTPPGKENIIDTFGFSTKDLLEISHFIYLPYFSFD